MMVCYHKLQYMLILAEAGLDEACCFQPGSFEFSNDKPEGL